MAIDKQASFGFLLVYEEHRTILCTNFQKNCQVSALNKSNKYILQHIFPQQKAMIIPNIC